MSFHYFVWYLLLFTSVFCTNVPTVYSTTNTTPCIEPTSLPDSIGLVSLKYPITVRTFDSLQLDSIRQHPDFDYTETPKAKKKKKKDKKETENTSDLNQQNNEDLLSDESLYLISQITIYSLVTLIAAFVLYQLFKNQVFENIFRPSKQPDYNLRYYEETEKDIYALNFSKLMKEALNKQQYRRAIRLQYLHSLKKLADQSLINWQLDKTNEKYVEELHKNNSPHYPDFNRLTKLFNYAWYGNFPIDQTAFKSINEQFEGLKSKLTKNNP